jgi:hypothetical protein
MEGLVLAIRDERPGWGECKIRRRLQDLGHQAVPSAAGSLGYRRNGRIESHRQRHSQTVCPVSTGDTERVVAAGLQGAFCECGWTLPSTDRDRQPLAYALGLRACGDEHEGTVQAAATAIFRCHGLPQCMLMDNGSPWDSSDAAHRPTWLSLWLLELGIAVSHGPLHHLQTQAGPGLAYRHIALRRTDQEGCFDVRCCAYGLLGRAALCQPVHYVPEHLFAISEPPQPPTEEEHGKRLKLL